ncbi:O-antigen ligase family protein [Aneurinibacillus soli]|uniref:O-antigen ligase family protein n=2 Tax=Aneurinibacillus soli TaxID=1500254 RepID=UPI0015614325|nr:O-antigen ligase family protein [Aneurinibacillus soli]
MENNLRGFLAKRNNLILLLCFLGMVMGYLVTAQSSMFLAIFAIGLFLIAYLTKLITITHLFCLIPLVSIFHIPLASVGGLNITALDTLIFLFYIFVILLIFMKKDVVLPVSLKQILLCNFIFIVPGFFSAFYFAGLSKAITGTILVGKKWAMYAIFLPAILFISDSGWKMVQKALLATVLIVSGVTMYSFIFPSADSAGGRASSLFFNPNVFAVLMVMLFNVSLGLLVLYRRNQLVRILIYICLLICLYGVIQSGSRTASIATVGILLFWLFQAKEISFKFKATAIGLLVTIALLGNLLLDTTSLFQRWTDVLDGRDSVTSVTFRIDAVQVAYYMFLDSPLFGYGFTNFTDLSQYYVAKYALLLNQKIETTDNQYMDTLLETGIVGIGCFFFMLAVITRHLWKQWNRSIFAKVTFANLILFLFAGPSMPSFYSPFTSAFFWYVFAVSFIELEKSGVI